MWAIYDFSDEVGFIHPSQFASLKAEIGDPVSSQEGLEYENTNFWNRDHKLAISTQILLPLYKAAKHAFMAALRKYNTPGNLSSKYGDDAFENEVMVHSRALLLLSYDFGTAWNSRFFPLLYSTLLYALVISFLFG